MSKVLVIPSSPALHGTMAAFHPIASTAGVHPPTFADVLAVRKRALEHFVHSLSFGSTMGLASATVAPPSPPVFEVLEGIGAVIMDEADADRALLRAAGADVLDNVEVPLINPEPEESEHEGFWHLDHIAIEAARDRGLTGKGVLVGVLDTGIDANHHEFANTSIDFAEFDTVGNKISSKPRDAGRHGTHVCGLISGQNAGVAPEADLAVAAVLTTKTASGLSGYLVQIAAGLDWLIKTSFRGDGGDPGVDILNASLGAAGYNSYLYTALANARLAPGTLMVAAIGNNGRWGVGYHGSPGNYDIVVGVGAVDRENRVAKFSDWGAVVQHGAIAKADMCAPGVGVRSSIPNGGYASLSGTSMASPIVCGAGALLIQSTPSYSSNVRSLQAALLAKGTALITPAERSVHGCLRL